MCLNLPSLRKLDMRSNKIKSISPGIKYLTNLSKLYLDHNQLSSLVPEIGALSNLLELSFENNRLFEIPGSLGQLTNLVTLKMAENQIKNIPPEIGDLGKHSLKILNLHSNNFTSFPTSFVHLAKLDELSLEWFLYVKPPKPKIVRQCTDDGRMVFEQLQNLLNLLIKHSMNECMLIIFLEYYSENMFNVDSTDNRLRTPLHNAAVKGDNGVLAGLL